MVVPLEVPQSHGILKQVRKGLTAVDHCIDVIVHQPKTPVTLGRSNGTSKEKHERSSVTELNDMAVSVIVALSSTTRTKATTGTKAETLEA